MSYGQMQKVKIQFRTKLHSLIRVFAMCWYIYIAPGREVTIANSGKSVNLLHSNCMLSVLIRMSTHNIQFCDKIRNICFIKLSEEFRRDSKTSSN